MAKAPDKNQWELFPEAPESTPAAVHREVTEQIHSTWDSIAELLLWDIELQISCPRCGARTLKNICEKCKAVIDRNGWFVWFKDDLIAQTYPNVDILEHSTSTEKIQAGSYFFITDKDLGFPRSKWEVLEIMMEIDDIKYKVVLYPNRRNIIQWIYTKWSKGGKIKYTRISNFPKNKFSKIVASGHEIIKNPEKYGIQNLKVMTKK